MFIGHFAAAFAAKGLERPTSLGTCFAAAQLPDLVWPFLLLAGYETVAIAPGDTAFTPLRFESYPITHSLLAVALWAAAFGGLHWIAKRRPRSALILGALVVSHWLLDFVSHRRDLPLVPGGAARLGLGLWNSVPATITVEAALLAGALWLYLRATRARDGVGRHGPLALVALLVLIYVANVLGPPPPSVRAVAVVGAFGGLFVLWAAWIDRHRTPREASGARDAEAPSAPRKQVSP